MPTQSEKQRTRCRSRCYQWHERWLLLLFVLVEAGRCRGGWIDPDTAPEFHTTKAMNKDDDRSYELVFSDEFEVDGRTFNDGNDPRWTAINKNDYTNDALHFYSHDNAHTANGMLNITTERKTNLYKAFNEKTKKFYVGKKYIQTAMLQGWNKFCFVGGIVEFSAKLPGSPHIGGLWPALWLLGNLARATYVGSSDYVWPFSYNECDPATQVSQEINACSRVNHYGLAPRRGRGAPEIDVIESMQGDPGPLPSTFIQRPYQSASLQIAPGVNAYRPQLASRPHPGHWYQHLEYSPSNSSDLNPFFYGVTLIHEPKSYTYQSDALSANLQLTDTHYNEQHLYRVEWEPPDVNGTGGYIKWFTDGELTYGVYGDSLKITGTEIPSEPMYLIMNTAVSSKWGFPAPCPEGCACECFECDNPDCACGMPSGYCDNFPATFAIDFVRVYQAKNESRHILGCSPESRPTELFIKGHEKRYMEEGQRRPLEPIRTGGALCSNDDNCGGTTRGSCTAHATCACQPEFTGPNCFASNAFYDIDTSQPAPQLIISTVKFPPSLVIAVGLLVLGFLFSVRIVVRRRSKDHYQDIGASHTTPNPSQHKNAWRPLNSYQNAASTDYVLPPKQKVVTYCVIDGRLVDA